MKIVVTGKNGLLSKELQNLDRKIIALNHIDYDITQQNIINSLQEINPDIIIHAAAMTNSDEVDRDKVKAINTNIVGTGYISQYCITNNKRLIYISTDYIYPGSKGNYDEGDFILPQNNYAWTKLGGECIVRLVNNHLIIRTSFGDSTFPYEFAWVNQIVSKDYVDIIAPRILMASKSTITGLLNIGTNAKSVFDYAKIRNPNVKKKYLKKKKNFSLSLEKYEKLFGNK